MSLQYQPAVGDIYMCEFPDCLRSPEMVKHRPVIIVSPSHSDRPDLVNVVPISMSAPIPPRPYHCPIPIGMMPAPLQDKAGDRWAKCDMVYTLSTSRLMLVRGAKNRQAGGKRLWFKGRVDLPTLQAVRRAIAFGMGITPDIFAVEAPVDIVVTPADRLASNA